MSQLNLSFPDNIYSASNKPSTATLKADLAAIEADFNYLESDAIRSDGTVAMAADLAMGTNQITNLGVPASASDAARLDSAYPVGTVYINADVATSPATLLGFGTWSQISQGRMLIGQNGSDTDFDTAGETGGAKTVTLTTAELPAHTHTGPAHTHTFSGTTASDGAHTHTVPYGASNNSGTGGAGPDAGTTSTSSNGAHTHTFSGTTASDGTGNTGSAGSGSAFSIMNPYIVVYIWKRVS